MRTAFDTFSGGLMVAAAAATDFFQFVITFIPFAGSILAKLAGLAFGLVAFLWLLLSGQLNMKTFAWLFGAASIELIPIPFLDMGPFWTGGIAALALMIVWKHRQQTRAEQKSTREQQLVMQRKREEEYEREQAQQQAAFAAEQEAALEQEEYAMAA